MSHLRVLVLAVPLAAAAFLFAPGAADAGGGGYRGYGYRSGYGSGSSIGVGIYIGGPYRSYPYGYYGPAYPAYAPGYFAPTYVAPAAPLPPTAPAQQVPSPQPAEARNPNQHMVETTVHVTVRSPADAEVWFGGQKTRQTGTVRRFVSPPLTPGQEYTYEVVARWMDKGRQVVQSRHIDVSAGSSKVVDFSQPEVEVIASPKPVSP
jgi:uncharacterized protein (TIGR03000 family)